MPQPRETGPRHDVTDLSRHSRAELDRMAAAGAEVLECVRVLEKTGDNIVGELLRGQGTFYEWNHYPDGDVYDRASHAQYYYHAHPKEERPGEHGHFHTFLRPKGMPARMKPAELAGNELLGGENDALSHIIAISMDAQGTPIGLFTTNRWVTGETWYAAKDVVEMIDLFHIDQARPSWPVNRWITAMIQLFRPQIGELLCRRDDVIAGWKPGRAGRDVFEDRKLEITSQMAISVPDQIRRVRESLEEIR